MDSDLFSNYHNILNRVVTIVQIKSTSHLYSFSKFAKMFLSVVWNDKGKEKYYTLIFFCKAIYLHNIIIKHIGMWGKLLCFSVRLSQSNGCID